MSRSETDLLAIAESVAARAGNGEDVEAWLAHEREFEVRVFDAQVEAVSSAEPSGAGVRLIAGDRVGFAYSTDLTQEGLDELVARARDNAQYATPDEAVGLATAADAASADAVDLVDPAFSDATPEAKVAFAVELDRSTKALDPRVRTVENAVYADSESLIAIATSTGIAASYRRTDAWCFVAAIATDGDDTEIGFEFDLARGLSGLDASAVARSAVERATGVLGATKIPSQKIPVVFDPYTAAQFIGVIGGALTAEAVQKGRSLFAGRRGQSVASSDLTLVDDGRAPDGPGSAPWDAEGVATRRTVVIGEGMLESFLYDVTTARRDGVSSTGNAARAGFKSGPSPAPTNLAFASTGHNRAQVLALAGERAFLVQDFHGVHSGANPVSGDFSVGATGRLLENGVPGRPIKEVTIAAPMLDILARIVAVADDRRWLPFGGSLGGATTLVSEMTVAGE